jgi:hypothetical protein
LTDSPDGERKVFRNAAVENFKDFYENFRRMNVRSNEQLETLIRQANDLVSGVDVKELRENKDIRQNLSQQMSEVKVALDSLITNAPRRRVMPMTE